MFAGTCCSKVTFLKTSYFSGTGLFFRESLELLEAGRGILILTHFCSVEFLSGPVAFTELAPDCISDFAYAATFWRLFCTCVLFFVNYS